MPERYLLITEGDIFVFCAKSDAFRHLSNNSCLNLSAKWDTAFTVSEVQLYGIILYLRNSQISLNYTIK